MPRLTPITSKSDVASEHHAVVDAVTKVFGNIRGPFSMLLHSPKLAEKLLPLVSFFRDESTVDAKLRLLAILTAVRERDAAYPWAAQVNAARRNGVCESLIDLIRAKGDPSALPEDERDVIMWARQLMHSNRPDAALFEKLNKRHGAEWMVELTTAAHYYALVGGVANAFDIPPLPDGDKLPA
jgi:4-carboxymuconolactone decarboxylase